MWGGSAEILLATSEENNSDVSMNVEATPSRLRLSGQTFGLRSKDRIHCTYV